MALQENKQFDITEQRKKEESILSTVRRPRETLGSINHNASAIPLPASALKRSNSISNFQQGPTTVNHARSISGSRMSLAPGRPNQPLFQRSSSGSNLADLGFSTVQRPSSSTTFHNTGGRKSYAAGNGTPASSLQLQQSTQRRSSSIYTGRHSSSMGQIGHQSFFTSAPMPAGVPRDPRPLKDRSYQAQIGQELMDYLTNSNFQSDMKHYLTQNTMKSPTQKDFNCIFQWLYHQIDPSYRFQKNIDAEVPPILKQLRYPFEKSITKSQLAAVGGQNWSTFLGLLHWMMQLAQMTEQYSAGRYDEACAEAGYDVSGDRIIFEFLSNSYHDWLQLEDEQDDQADQLLKPHVNTMAQKFDDANAKYLDQVKMLEADNKALRDQIGELGKSGPRIAKLDEQTKILEDDRVKFETYNASMDQKVEKYEGRVKLLQDEIERINAELQEAEQEKTDLKEAVDAQGITIQDIDRMNTERERLLKGVEAALVRLEESKEKVRQKELDASQMLESLERAVQEYNSLAYQVALIPSTAANAQGQNYELSVTVNGSQEFRSSRSRRSSPTAESDRLLADTSSGYQPQHLLNLDMKDTIKNRLICLRKEISDRKNASAEDDMNNKDLLEKIREAIEEKQQEVDGLGHRVRAAEEEYEKTKELTNTSKTNSDAQIEKLEKQLADMRTAMSDSIQLMEQREMNTIVEYEQMTLRTAALREELHTEVERMLNEIIKFKVHIQSSLSSYEEFIAKEVEAECEEQDTELEEALMEAS